MKIVAQFIDSSFLTLAILLLPLVLPQPASIDSRVWWALRGGCAAGIAVTAWRQIQDARRPLVPEAP
jgi:hypothetical protein